MIGQLGNFSHCLIKDIQDGLLSCTSGRSSCSALLSCKPGRTQCCTAFDLAAGGCHAGQARSSKPLMRHAVFAWLVNGTAPAWACRDIKLDNALLDGRSFILKLSDWGYSKHDKHSVPQSRVGTRNYIGVLPSLPILHMICKSTAAGLHSETSRSSSGMCCHPVIASICAGWV